ncbi:unnamed protein product, partial [Brenthis ino]
MQTLCIRELDTRAANSLSDDGLTVLELTQAPMRTIRVAKYIDSKLNANNFAVLKARVGPVLKTLSRLHLTDARLNLLSLAGKCNANGDITTDRTVESPVPAQAVMYCDVQGGVPSVINVSPEVVFRLTYKSMKSGDRSSPTKLLSRRSLDACMDEYTTCTAYGEDTRSGQTAARHDTNASITRKAPTSPGGQTAFTKILLSFIHFSFI